MFNDRFLYFPEERLSRYVNATGAVTSFRYDANNLVVEEIDPLGARTVSEWDALERLQRRIDPAGRETRFAYDGDGRLIAQTDWAGRSWGWRYDRWGALVGFEGPDGTASWVRDQGGNIVRWTGADGVKGTARYDERGALAEESVVGAGIVRYDNDAAGRPVARHDPPSASGEERVTRYRWDRFGRLLELTDPAGRTSTWPMSGRPRIRAARSAWPGRRMVAKPASPMTGKGCSPRVSAATGRRPASSTVPSTRCAGPSTRSARAPASPMTARGDWPRSAMRLVRNGVSVMMRPGGSRRRSTGPDARRSITATRWAVCSPSGCRIRPSSISNGTIATASRG